ncbi:uncharacterized protein LOC4576879 [Anopheles gambiae]|uniref:uncharacterized protein LOC4576879 n=1 Tax=Anopheles gambiae TaxID=7165 RepID=UPI002AC93DA0|nr:uncharacterized protein LOC4576879 [Anopheles gambiae]
MGCSEIMRNLGDLVMNNKLVTFLSVALFAFVITVIALAVSNNNNASDLEECQARLAEFLSSTTTTIVTPETTTTVAPTPETTTQATPPPPSS